MSQTTRPTLDHGFGRADLDEVADALTGELATTLGGGMDPHAVRSQLRIALEELRGSVSYESLSEMAVRLARHRIESGSVAWRCST